jgi:serine/threonine-protein kinase RsbW
MLTSALRLNIGPERLFNSPAKMLRDRTSGEIYSVARVVNWRSARSSKKAQSRKMQQLMTAEIESANYEEPRAGTDLLKMSMPAEPRFVSFARRAVSQVLLQLSLSAQVRDDILIAFSEACSNAVLYGALKPCTPIRLLCRTLHDHRREPRQLEIEIRNHGEGFASHVDRQDFEMPSPESLSEHGRGLPLMKHLVDDVQFLSQDGDTIVRLLVELPN